MLAALVNPHWVPPNPSSVYSNICVRCFHLHCYSSIWPVWIRNRVQACIRHICCTNDYCPLFVHHDGMGERGCIAYAPKPAGYGASTSKIGGSGLSGSAAPRFGASPIVIANQAGNPQPGLVFLSVVHHLCHSLLHQLRWHLV